MNSDFVLGFTLSGVKTLASHQNGETIPGSSGEDYFLSVQATRIISPDVFVNIGVSAGLVAGSATMTLSIPVRW